MTERDVIKDIIQKQINDALECAAVAVYDSEHTWTDEDVILHCAAQRVRALKVRVIHGENEDKK